MNRYDISDPATQQYMGQHDGESGAEAVRSMLARAGLETDEQIEEAMGRSFALLLTTLAVIEVRRPGESQSE